MLWVIVVVLHLCLSVHFKSLSGGFSSLACFFDRFSSANTHWYCTVLIVTRVPLVVLTLLCVCVCVCIHDLCQDNLPITYFGFPFISVTTNGPDHCCLNCWIDYFPCSCPYVVPLPLDISSGSIWCGLPQQLHSHEGSVAGAAQQSLPSSSLPHSSSSAPQSPWINTGIIHQHSCSEIWNHLWCHSACRPQPAGTFSKGKRWDLQLPWRCAKDFLLFLQETVFEELLGPSRDKKKSDCRGN